MEWAMCSLLREGSLALMRRPAQDDMEGVWAHLGTLVVEPPPLMLQHVKYPSSPRGQGGVSRLVGHRAE
jgi:hypothetical protein